VIPGAFENPVLLQPQFTLKIRDISVVIGYPNPLAEGFPCNNLSLFNNISDMNIIICEHRALIFPREAIEAIPA
jgi:hypothetical protein